MRNIIAISFMFIAQAALAQDLVIANARVVDGMGGSIDRANVIVEDGRIAAVSDDLPADVPTIDATGMTVLPGLINTHWHLFAGSAADSEAALARFVDEAVAGTLENILERGVTTIMSPGDHLSAILDARAKLAAGELRGPRLLAVGPVFTAPDDWPTQICQDNAACNARLNVTLTTEADARQQVTALLDTWIRLQSEGFANEKATTQ